MRPTVLVLLLAGCEAATIKLDPVDTGADDTGRPDDSGDTADSADSGETGDSSDTGETGDSGETGETGETGEPPPPPPDWTVDCRGGADFRTIQEAIDAATSGDQIALQPCTYHERLDYLGKSLDIFGVKGSAETIIDGDEGGTVVNVETGESDGTRLAGVTIRGGLDSAAGSALEVMNAVLVLDDVVLTENGEGLQVLQSYGGQIDATDLVVTGNRIAKGGVAILADGGSFTGLRVTADCETGVAAIYAHNPLLLADSAFTCDAGSGIYNYHGEIDLRRVTAIGGQYGLYSADEEDNPSERARVYNSAFGSDAIGAYFFWQDVDVANSVFWGGSAGVQVVGLNANSALSNSVVLRSPCGITGDGARLRVTYTDFWDNDADLCKVTASVAMSADPQFTSFPGDLTPRASSPLIDAGDPAREANDQDGTRNDIGVTGGPWSAP